MKNVAAGIQAFEFTAAEIFDLETHSPAPGAPRFLNLDFKPKQSRKEMFDGHGPGIYSIFFEDKLIYVGLFANTSSDITRLRWQRHLQTLSLRGRNVGMSEATFQALLQDGRFQAMKTGFSQANPEWVVKDRGFQTTVNRARFAADHWSEFQNFTPHTLGKFAFKFLRYSDGTLLAPERWKTLLTGVETSLVRALQPCCNSAVEGPSIINAQRASFVEAFVLEQLIHAAPNEDALELLKKAS